VRIAFKEWAVVVDALGRGDQILLLRKGGISEGRGGFQVEHPQFLFFPTLFHQQRQSVLSGAQSRFDQIAPYLPPAGRVRLELVATVASWRSLHSLAAVERLRGQHIWRDEVIAQRFEWGRSNDLFAIACRVHRLTAPVELPMLGGYGGCRSWVELERDVATIGAMPVLSDQQFAERLNRFHAATETGPAK
jgi:hypothetical protein